LFIDVLFGCGCALIGTFFPYPRLASTALERRGRNSGAIVGCLFHDTISTSTTSSCMSLHRSPPRTLLSPSHM
jgi:hypothetical protein